MYYGARYYDSALGRFISPDTIVPNPGNPQALNRYTYANNSPLTYIDSDGHFAFVPLLIIGGIALLKAIDYGWTAYDAAQSLKVMNAPNASEAAKTAAAANLAMAAAFEAAEPDDFLPVALPLDDLARKGILKIGKEAGERAGKDAVEQVSETAYKAIRAPTDRSALRKAMEKAGMTAPADMTKSQAHHNSPWDFKDWFAGGGRGLNVNDVQFGRWVEGSPVGTHQNWTAAYNNAWRNWISQNPNATRDQVLQFLDALLASGQYP